jgi:hypothetical protein
VKLGDNLIGIAVLLPFAIVVAFPIAMIFCDYLNIPALTVGLFMYSISDRVGQRVCFFIRYKILSRFDEETEVFIYGLTFVSLFFLSCLLGIVFSIKSSEAGEINRNIYSLFKEEIEAERSDLKFRILDSSYAEFNFVGGFADGRYKLVSYRIKSLGRGVFKLYLLFEKKKGVFRYREKIILYFWQGDREIVFLTKDGKKKFELPEEAVKVVKTKEGYKIVGSFPIKIFVIPLEHVKVYLKVRRLKNNFSRNGG